MVEEAIRKVMLMQRPRQFSLVLEIPAASPDEASAHFAAKLSVETDISDLMFDLQRGYEGFVLLDVRDQAAFDACHIPGAVHVPARQIDGIEYWRQEGGLVEGTLSDADPLYWQGPEWP